MMKIYPNIFAVIPELANMNEWLMVDDSEWENDPKNAKIYIFDEDEMYDLEEKGLAKIGEYFDEFPLLLELADKQIRYLSESAMLEDIIEVLARYEPNYTDEQLIYAVNYYNKNDTFYQPEKKVRMNIWVANADAKNLGELKQLQQEFTAMLGNPKGINWVKSNRPTNIVQMATLYGDGKFVDTTEFTTAIKEKLGNDTANAVCLLVDKARKIDMTSISLPQYTGVNLVYLGKFDMVFNAKK